MTSDVTSELMQRALAGARRSRDEHVGHLAEVDDDGLAGDVATDRHVERVGRRRRPRPRPSRSPSATSVRCRLGTSTPIAERPGIGARIRTSGEAMA